MRQIAASNLASHTSANFTAHHAGMEDKQNCQPSFLLNIEASTTALSEFLNHHRGPGIGRSTLKAFSLV